MANSLTFLKILCFFILFFIIIVSLLAQKITSTDSLKNLAIDTITISDRAVFKSGTLAKEELAEKFMQRNMQGTLVNALEQLPGLSAINTGVGVAKPVIRGLSFQRIIVNHNGIKQEGQQWGADHGLEIDQYDVERLEIVKGPVSLMYGSDGLGGVINVLPMRVPLENLWKANLQTVYKSNNNHLASSGQLVFRKNQFFGAARFTTQDFGDYVVPADSFVYNTYILPIYNQHLKNTAGQERNVNAQFGLIQDKCKLRLFVSQYQLEAGIFSGAIGIPRVYQLFEDQSYRDRNIPKQKVVHSKSSLQLDYTGSNYHWQAIIGYQHNLRQEFSYPHAHDRVAADSSNIALELNLSTATLNTKFTRTPTADYQETYGLSFQYQQNRRSGFEFLLPHFSTIRSGLYYLGEYQWKKNMRTSAGIRLDYGGNHTQFHNQLIDIDDDGNYIYELRANATNVNFYNYAASIGLDWTLPSDGTNVKVNIGKSFRIPSPAETVSNGVHHGTFRHELGTPDLQSEHGYQLDISGAWRLPKNRLEVSTYFNYFDEFIYLRPTAKFSPLPDAGQLYQYNQNDAIYAGLEGSWQWDVFSFLQFRQNVEYVWNYNLDSRTPLPFTPPASIRTELEYHVSRLQKLENIYFNINSHYFFAQYRVDKNEPATPVYHLLSTGAGLSVGSIQLNLEVQNLLNIRYLNHLSRYRILNIPEQGCNFILGIKFNFT